MTKQSHRQRKTSRKHNITYLNDAEIAALAAKKPGGSLAMTK
ncbi:MAG: hypothetical protein WBB67_10685 [bacterium]